MITAAVDLGNTRSKVFVFEDHILRKDLVINEKDVADLADLLNEYNPESAIFSSVINDNPFENIFREREIKLIYLSHETNLPIKLDYKTPKTLGLDRIANAVGAASLYPQKNVLVIDAGTCIKYDLITEDGIYRGGAISPGVEMRFKAMHNFTDKLPLITGVKSFLSPGKTTEESMTIGNLTGIKHEIDGFISQYSALYSNLTVVLTGGDSNLFDKELKNSIFAHSFLTALGLNEILHFQFRA